MGEPVFLWGWHAGHRQPTAVPVAQIVRKSARVREEQRKRTHLRQAEQDVAKVVQTDAERRRQIPYRITHLAT